MATNPLQQYFRQPKIFLKLPTLGVYNQPGSIEGSADNLPVFGMTGMDEILVKTPDALLNGEATVKIIESCCPGIKNGWDVNNLDLDALLVAIRIATYGETMTVGHVCKNCSNEMDFDVSLPGILDHFNRCTFDSKLVFSDLTIKLKPLTYKEATAFNLENFAFQKRLTQAVEIQDEEIKQKHIADIFKEVGELQNRVFMAGVESVETPHGVVTERAYIKEWLENADKVLFDKLKEHINKNNEVWRIPENHIKCDNCGHEDNFRIELDQSSFFVNA